MPRRRVNRHLFTPPLPQRAGIDPVSLTLPAHPVLHETTQGPDAHPSTVAQYLISRFSPEDPATILDCFARHEVRTDDGAILTDQTPYLPGLRIWYYRPLPEEPPLPDDLPILYEDEHLLAVEAASAQLQRDPPVGAGERHEGGVGPGGDIEEDRAAFAGGQDAEVAPADAQRGGGIGWDEFEEHEPGLSGEYRLSGGLMR